MRRKKYGFILIALLVLSGLAGTPYDTALNKKERKFLLAEMKESRTAFLNSIRELSDRQLNFIPANGKSSIRDHVLKVMNTQRKVYDEVDLLMKRSTNGRSRIDIKWTDEELRSGITYWLEKENPAPKTKVSTTLAKMIDNFTRERSKQVMYVKTTTEDLRNHVMPHSFFGQLDCYQWLLVVSHQCAELTAQIEAIKKDPGFPKR